MASLKDKCSELRHRFQQKMSRCKVKWAKFEKWYDRQSTKFEKWSDRQLSGRFSIPIMIMVGLSGFIAFFLLEFVLSMAVLSVLFATALGILYRKIKSRRVDISHRTKGLISFFIGVWMLYAIIYSLLNGRNRLRGEGLILVLGGGASLMVYGALMSIFGYNSAIEKQNLLNNRRYSYK